MTSRPFFIRSEKNKRLLIALFFLALTVIGIVTSFDYGYNFDARSEQNTLRFTVYEYAYHILGEDHWLTEYYEWLGYERLYTFAERDHGQSPYYLAAPLLKLSNHAPEWLRPAWNIYTWLWFMAGVWAIYAFCREMGWGRRAACMSAMLLYLAPRFFAEGHYNTKDVTLLCLMLAVLWLGLRFLKKPGFVRAIVFSFFGAMTANIRLPGILPWGMVGIAALVLRFTRRDWSLRMGGVALCTVLSFAGFYVLLTPAMWTDPGEYFAYLLRNSTSFSRWDFQMLFQGALYHPAVTPLPAYYIPYMMTLTLPLYTLPLAFLGQGSAIGEMLRSKAAFFRDERRVMLLVLSLMWLLPMLYAVLGQPLVYNSWRHFYFMYAGIVLLAAYGISRLGALCARRKTAGRAGIAAVCAGLLLSAAGIGLNHPYQYGYFNLLAGSHVENREEIDYWELSAISALRVLKGMEGELRYPLVVGGGEQQTHIALGEYKLFSDLKGSIVLAREDPEVPYKLYNVGYSIIYDAPHPPEGYHELFRIGSYGNTLCIMYEKDD